MKTCIAGNFNHKNSAAILNELFAKLDCSLARYLSYARPWTPRPNMLLDALVRRLSYEHEIFASNIARLIYDRRGTVRSCVFPMDFASYNDLSLEYLAPRLLEHERALIVSSEKYAERLRDDPEARRLLARIIAALRRYATLLAEVMAPTRQASLCTAIEAGVTSMRDKAPSPTATERLEQPKAESQTAA